MANHPNRSKQPDSSSRNPAPDEIRALREAAGLTQTRAAELVHTTCRTWQQWEADEGTPASRKMHPAFFELFKIKLSVLKSI